MENFLLCGVAVIFLISGQVTARRHNLTMSYKIERTWDDRSLDHDGHKVTLQTRRNHIVMRVRGSPLFNDPPAPNTPEGATDQLWNYEVIEAFFLNEEDETYLEVELGPHGHHLVLLLDGARNAIKKLLPLKYRAKISQDGKRWSGQALIPRSYFPPKVTKFNAFAIHGSSPNIQYEELYPQIEPKTQPDFHRLQDFQSIDFNQLIDDNESRSYSAVWKEARANPNV